jgi:phospholipid/cholesterol/gamma-HCH transport system substrate-binding protein
MQNLESLTAEANALTHAARGRYVDNPKILHTIDNIERITTDIQRDTGPMLKDAKEGIANLNRASATIGAPEEQAKIKKALDDVAQLAAHANAAAADAQSIVSHIKKGEGSVGAFVMDEEVYDNVQEMVRDLKHNPWKFLWRE